MPQSVNCCDHRHSGVPLTMDAFADRYKSYSNTALIGILENARDYQPAALLAAKAELVSRNLSPEQHAAAVQEWRAIQAEKAAHSPDRLFALLEKGVRKVWEAINPIRPALPTSEKLIRMVTLLLILVTLIYWYTDSTYLIDWLSDPGLWMDRILLGQVLIILLLPLATVFWALKKSVGWYLVAGFLVYSTLYMAGLFLLATKNAFSDPTTFLSLFTVISVVQSGLWLAFWVGTMWVLSMPEIRLHYKVKNQTAISVLAIAFLFAVWVISPVLIDQFV